MLSKCIGIISYFPDELKSREERIYRFNRLINCLDTYFKLPIVIIAQNWKDFKMGSYSNTIYIYKYKSGLGITTARRVLREKLLGFCYDYFIFLDDDSDIKCTEKGVKNYLEEIDIHPDMVGKFFYSWPRLLAISKSMLQKMDYEFIKNYDATRGEIWEDMAYIKTYSTLYPDKFFKFSKLEISENSPVSKKDVYSTWYKKEYGDEKEISRATRKIINEWIISKRR